MIRSINEPQVSREMMFTPASINEPLALPEGGKPEAPTLSSLDPAVATIGAADVTMQCTGSNFTPSAFITFNGGQETTQWHSATKVTTIVKPSTATTPGFYPVTVVTQFGESEAKSFEFRESDGGTKVRAAYDPDTLEEEIEEAEEEGDFKSMHPRSKKK